MTVKLLEYHSDKAGSFCVSSCALLRPVSLWLLLESENGWVWFIRLWSLHERTDQLGRSRVWNPGSGKSFPASWPV